MCFASALAFALCMRSIAKQQNRLYLMFGVFSNISTLFSTRASAKVGCGSMNGFIEGWGSYILTPQTAANTLLDTCKPPAFVNNHLRAMGWENFSLVGHSMGGAVASLVAASFPEMVERCVFIDILGPFAFSPGTSPQRLRKSVASRSESIHPSSRLLVFMERGIRTRFERSSLQYLSMV